MSESERRRHPRLRKDAPLILIQPDRSGEGAVLCDVSMSGLAFETSFKLEVGTAFDFALYVPERGWVDGAGRVRWVKRRGRGWLCGASISIAHRDQDKLLGKWLGPSSKGLLRYFFPA